MRVESVMALVLLFATSLWGCGEVAGSGLDDHPQVRQSISTPATPVVTSAANRPTHAQPASQPTSADPTAASHRQAQNALIRGLMDLRHIASNDFNQNRES